jgi:hypothetical protein
MEITEINDHRIVMNNEIKGLIVALTDKTKDGVHKRQFHQKWTSKRVQQL